MSINGCNYHDCKANTGKRPLPGDNFTLNITTYAGKGGKVTPCLTLFIERVKERLHLGQLSADISSVIIPYFQRSEVSLVPHCNVRTFNPYGSMSALVDVYGPQELGMALAATWEYATLFAMPL